MVFPAARSGAGGVGVAAAVRSDADGPWKYQAAASPTMRSGMNSGARARVPNSISRTSNPTRDPAANQVQPPRRISRRVLRRTQRRRRARVRTTRRQKRERGRRIGRTVDMARLRCGGVDGSTIRSLPPRHGTSRTRSCGAARREPTTRRAVAQGPGGGQEPARSTPGARGPRPPVGRLPGVQALPSNRRAVRSRQSSACATIRARSAVRRAAIRTASTRAAARASTSTGRRSARPPGRANRSQTSADTTGARSVHSIAVRTPPTRTTLSMVSTRDNVAPPSRMRRMACTPERDGRWPFPKCPLHGRA